MAKYTSVSISGYNATPPSDDGTVSESNKVKWSTEKTKLTDPLKTALESINTNLVSAFDVGPTALVVNTTLGASHYGDFIQVSGAGVTLTLTDAATLGAGWYTKIISTDSTNTVTLGRATGGDTINGTAANISLYPYQPILIFVNAAATGFIAISMRTHSKEEKHESVLTMLSSSVWMAEGADVASAADCNIWTTDGNTVHITGTTTISDWGTAPQAGAGKWIIFDDALQLTYNATTNKLNSNGANYTTVAGDRAFVYAESTSSYLVLIFPLNGGSAAATPGRDSDSTVLASTAWVRDHIGEPSSNMTVFKCGAVNLPQNVTRFLPAVGGTATATEGDTNVPIGLPTEFYGMKVYLSEAVPSAQTLTVTLRVEAADSTLTTTITGPTSAGAVVDVSGSVIVGKGVSGTPSYISVKTVTSATFGNTNDITVTLLAQVPGSNRKPVSPFAFGGPATGVTDFHACGEFKTGFTAQPSAAASVRASRFPTPAHVFMKYDQRQNTPRPYITDSSTPITGNYNYPMPDGTVMSFAETTVNTAATGYFVISDRECGNDKGTWSPLLFSFTDQPQSTTRYATGYGLNAVPTATEADIKVPLPAGKVWKLRAYAADAVVPAGQSAVITVRKNGVDTALAVTLDNSNKLATDTSDTVTFDDNDLISISCVSSATAGTNTYNVVLELDKVD